MYTVLFAIIKGSFNQTMTAMRQWECDNRTSQSEHTLTTDSNICQPHLLGDEEGQALWLQYHIFVPSSAAVDVSSLHAQEHNQLLVLSSGRWTPPSLDSLLKPSISFGPNYYALWSNKLFPQPWRDVLTGARFPALSRSLELAHK